jgi:uncharacterized coiled-coil protein SlyX
MKTKNMTTLRIRNSTSHSHSLITYHYSLLTILLLALCCFGLSPAPQAFGVSPAPDGGYPGNNTAEGDSALFSLTTGANNTANGFAALAATTTGNSNTATGFGALYDNMSGSRNTANGVYALYSNTTGDNNTANGLEALFSNTTGSLNTANGSQALFSNTTGAFNTATGFAALYGNTTGFFNTGVGLGALDSNITGSNNTAIGVYALANNTTAADNTATGYEALFSTTTGTQNTANGGSALFSNTTGPFNNAFGNGALYSNTTGDRNTAMGVGALFANSTGASNTALGVSALRNNNASRNTAVGHDALLNNNGTGNIALGYQAGKNLTTGSNNIDIGDPGQAGEDATIRIGGPCFLGACLQTSAFIAGVYGATTVGTAIPVLIDGNGQLGTISSSRRFKKEIKPMDQTSEAILALKPVTFHYKSDTKSTPQFGLIAEEVADVNPDLVVRDAKGEIYTVRYDAVNAMLLNEFLKEHRTLQELKSTVARQEAIITQQQKGMEAVIARLKEQDSKIQKVSDQFELPKVAPQMALNNH